MAGSMSRMQRRLGHVGGFWAGLVGVVLMVSACSVAKLGSRGRGRDRHLIILTFIDNYRWEKDRINTSTTVNAKEGIW